MGSGYRDGFNDYIADGSFGDDTSFDNPIRTYRRKKKSKTHRRTTSNSRRRRRTSSRPQRRASKSKRKGMSKEFLRNLRRKHGLGEFKK